MYINLCLIAMLHKLKYCKSQKYKKKMRKSVQDCNKLNQIHIHSFIYSFILIFILFIYIFFIPFNDKSISS